MSEFINEFGKENFIIIIAVVAAIIVALAIIVLIEKFQAKRDMKKQLKREISNYNRNMPERKNQIIEETIDDIEQLSVKEKFEKSEDNYEEIIDKKPQEVVYVEKTNTREEAKEKLEEVTKKLIEENNDLIDHTDFETEQEEKSIISYDELVKASHDIDEKNDKLLEDEGEAAITIEELYQKHVDVQNEIEDEKPEVKVNNPVFEDNKERKFKNSEVISPVFGLYNGRVKPKEKTDPKEIFTEMDKNIEMKDLEAEIEKTEEFLTELKRLKNKLD